MARGLSKLKSLGVGNRVGTVIGRITGAMWEVSSIISRIGITQISFSVDGTFLNEVEARKQDKLREDWTRARRILYWCESRTRKLVILGSVLTTVSILIRIILRIAKLAARFSPPAAADFATTYYKAQDILKRTTTTSAVITTMVAMINRMCSDRLNALLAVQDKADAHGSIDFGVDDPDPFFNFDESEFEARLADIQSELEELNRTRAPQTQSECDLIFQKLDAINTLDAIVVDVTAITDNPFIMAQYAGSEGTLDALKTKIRRLRTEISQIPSTGAPIAQDTPQTVNDLPHTALDDSGFELTTKKPTLFIKGSGQ